MNDAPDVNNEALPVARVYAEALWNLAQRDGTAEELLEEYDALVKEVLDADPAVEKFFATVTIGREAKQESMAKALEGNVSDLLFNFLRTLNRHDRLNLVRLCNFALHEIADASRGIVPVEVCSVVPLTEAQQESLTTMIRERFRVEPRLHTRIDKSLLGGLWIRVGDTVLDRTLKTSLRKLRDVIRTRNSYEIQSGRSYFDSPSGN